MRGAGLQERFPNRLRVGVLIGYNYISSCTRKIGSIPTPLEASWSFARRTVLMESTGISSARPTLSGRVHFGPPRGYPGVIFPTVAPERLSVVPQHIFSEVLGRAVAERFDRRCNDRHACLFPSSGKVFVRGVGFILSDQEPNAWQGFCPLILLGKLPGYILRKTS